jgi:hypothetical protein
VLGDNPVVYYPLNETSGTVATDISGNAVNGVYGSSVGLGGPKLLSADTGDSAVFNGSTSGAAADYIQVPASSVLKATTAVTVEAWVNLTASPFNTYIYVLQESPATTGNAPYMLSVFGGQVVGRIYTGSAGTALSSEATLALGKPYHLVLTYDGAKMSLYINGALDSTTPVKGTLGSYGTGDLGIGHQDAAGQSAVFQGDIPNVAVYTTALSAARVAFHYQAANESTSSRCPSHICTPGQSFTSDPLNCGACAHNCLGGTCTAGVCQPVTLATDTHFAQLSQDGSNLYWTSYETSGTSGGVYKVAKAAGSTKKQIVKSTYANAISVVSGDIYYSAYQLGQESSEPVMQVPVAGGTSTVLFTPPTEMYQMLTTTTINVYYYEGQYIQQYSVSSGKLTRLGSTTGFGDVFGHIALDDSNLYAPSNREPIGFLAIDPKSGGEVDLQRQDEPGGDHGGISAVVSDNNNHLFWSNDGENLTHVIATSDALAGKSDYTTFLNYSATGLLYEDGYVYAAVPGQGLLKESVEGGPVTTIYGGAFAIPPTDLSTVAPRTALASDACAVYFVDSSGHLDMLAR